VPDNFEEEWPNIGAELVALAKRTPIGHHMFGASLLTLIERTKASKANTDARKIIEKKMVDGVSKDMDSQNMESILHIPVPSVETGANLDGALGQRLKCTMNLLSNARKCQQQLDDNQEGPSVAWTSVLANFHDDVRQLASERQTVQGQHWDVLRSKEDQVASLVRKRLANQMHFAKARVEAEAQQQAEAEEAAARQKEEAILPAARQRASDAASEIQKLLNVFELKDASQERFAQLGNAVRNLDDATRPIRQDAGALTVRYHDMPGVFPHFWKQRVVQMQIVSCDCCCVTFMLGDNKAARERKKQQGKENTAKEKKHFQPSRVTKRAAGERKKPAPSGIARLKRRVHLKL